VLKKSIPLAYIIHFVVVIEMDLLYRV